VCAGSFISVAYEAVLQVQSALQSDMKNGEAKNLLENLSTKVKACFGVPPELVRIERSDHGHAQNSQVRTVFGRGL
jgi:hypothetical protein